MGTEEGWVRVEGEEKEAREVMVVKMEAAWTREMEVVVDQVVVARRVGRRM